MPALTIRRGVPGTAPAPPARVNRRILASALACAIVLGIAQPRASADEPDSLNQAASSIGVPARDVSATDADLAGVSGEVIVTRIVDGVPEFTKLRADSPAAAEKLQAGLDAKPGIVAELNEPVRFSAEALPAGSTPRLADEPYGLSQWGLRAVGAPAAWASSRGEDVVVAVLDTGIDPGVPEFAGRLRPQIDIPKDGATGSVHWHGTHVAGILGAALDRRGGAGLANRATILPVRVFDKHGVGDNLTLARGIIRAVAAGAKVISFSGGGSESAALKVAVDYARNNDVVVVAAAGNEFEEGNPITYPAAYPSVIGVGSHGPQGLWSSFSNTGSYVDLSAPGEDILSTVPGGAWRPSSGTSMATPFVAAAAALVRSVNPNLTAAQVESVLESTAADDVQIPGPDDAMGYGMVRADLAVELAASLRGARTSTPVTGNSPAAPTSVKAVRGSNRATVSWSAHSRVGAAETMRYRVRATPGGNTCVTTGRSCVVLGLTNGVTYRFTVVAINEVGASAPSKPTAPVTPRPQIRVVASAVQGSSRISVNVNPDMGRSYWVFRIQRLHADGVWRNATTAKRTLGDSERRTLNLPRGDYRAVVYAGHGYLGATSHVIHLSS